MNEQQPWYVEQRAKALALVYLTRRDDLVVRQEHEPDYGLDFIVEIVDKDQPTRKVFGIQLKGSTSITVEEAASDTFTSTLQDQQWLVKLPFPVCLFLFAVKDSVGFYRWLTRRVVAGVSARKL